MTDSTSTTSAKGAAGDVRGTVAVTLGATGYEAHIAAGGHALTADEPASAGGTNRGPSPYDLLLASLGACTAMTLRMYADRKGWPLHGVTVRLRHDRMHAKDCADCESKEGYITRIARAIEMDGDELSDDQRTRLMEIADRCPVHRTLAHEIRIDSEMA